MSMEHGDRATNDDLAAKLNLVGEHLKRQDGQIAELTELLQGSVVDRAQLNRRMAAVEESIMLINPERVAEMAEFLAWHLSIRRWFLAHKVRTRLGAVCAGLFLIEGRDAIHALVSAMLMHFGAH